MDLHLLFIDFEKAFDCIHRERLWKALRKRENPEKVIQSSYAGAKCRDLHQGKMSEQFKSGIN